MIFNIEANLELNSDDIQIVQFFIQLLQYYNENSIMSLDERFKGLKFKDYYFGSGANHIWIHRKSGDKKIVTITKDNK